MIHWNLSKEALLHSNITGSCTLISNPLPMSDLDVLACNYRSSTIVVDKYTVTINFIIYNITQSCHIYCYLYRRETFDGQYCCYHEHHRQSITTTHKYNNNIYTEFNCNISPDNSQQHSNNFYYTQSPYRLRYRGGS